MTPKEKYLICFNCENLENRKCKLCGCNMVIKVIVPFAKCPINKWSEINEN